MGNILYYLAETVKIKTNSQLKGMILLVIGRMSIGIGGARLMTRKYFAINVEIYA